MLCVQLFSSALLLDIAVLVPPRTHWYVVRSIKSGRKTTSTKKLDTQLGSHFWFKQKRLDFIVICLCVLIAIFLKNKNNVILLLIANVFTKLTQSGHIMRNRKLFHFHQNFSCSFTHQVFSQMYGIYI